ncbi:glycosyltransferase family 2 protein [Candidatus Bathyarchaeota archaeon]|nr:glycosyltransferase family 2 protein [Candidatus Bathyarchaeota archaeon]
MQAQPKSIFKPPVSIIVPAYNGERLIPACLTSLFKSAAQYGGFCEIIVVDDGSTDHTYEMAWATIQECRGKQPHIVGKVVRHTAKLGRNHALKTGANKAFGTIIAVVEPQALWKPQTLKELVETFEKHGKNPSNSTTAIYKADTLRKLLWKT